MAFLLRIAFAALALASLASCVTSGEQGADFSSTVQDSAPVETWSIDDPSSAGLVIGVAKTCGLDWKRLLPLAAELRSRHSASAADPAGREEAHDFFFAHLIVTIQRGGYPNAPDACQKAIVQVEDWERRTKPPRDETSAGTWRRFMSLWGSIIGYARSCGFDQPRILRLVRRIDELERNWGLDTSAKLAARNAFDVRHELATVVHYLDKGMDCSLARLTFAETEEALRAYDR